MNNLKQVRQAQGATQATLVAKTRTSNATLVLIEKYGFEPSEKTKDKIAQALEVSVESIWPNPTHK